MGALVSTAAIMGPKTKVRFCSTYEEPSNPYLICLAEPGARKSQAFRLSITEPLYTLHEPSASMQAENYTQLELFKHLKDHDVSAFFDVVQ